MKRDIMEVETMVMIRDHQHKLNNHSTQNSSWKLYQNPFYYHSRQQKQQDHLPSARKLAACLWDLTFMRTMTDSELDMARARIHELKAELEHERKTRKKVESLNKKLCKQILEERKKREAVEDLCEKLAKEISSEKVEIDRMKKDIVEERKMLRVAEVLREERVQMKLSDAKFLFEEKLSELESSKVSSIASASASVAKLEMSKVSSISIGNESARASSCSIENSSSINILGSVGSTSMNKRRASPEPENPHIKRGIKGFVEFPRVVKAISSKGRQLGSKVECQKAQLRLLLRQKSPFRSDHLIMG